MRQAPGRNRTPDGSYWFRRRARNPSTRNPRPPGTSQEVLAGFFFWPCGFPIYRGFA